MYVIFSRKMKQAYGKSTSVREVSTGYSGGIGTAVLISKDDETGMEFYL